MAELIATNDQLVRTNESMCRDNHELKLSLERLTANLEVLSRHNHEKNRETELLMQNSFDYYPISPGAAQEASLGSVRYSVSSHPHPRII